MILFSVMLPLHESLPHSVCINLTLQNVVQVLPFFGRYSCSPIQPINQGVAGFQLEHGPCLLTGPGVLEAIGKTSGLYLMEIFLGILRILL